MMISTKAEKANREQLADLISPSKIFISRSLQIGFRCANKLGNESKKLDQFDLVYTDIRILSNGWEIFAALLL